MLALVLLHEMHEGLPSLEIQELVTAPVSAHMPKDAMSGGFCATSILGPACTVAVNSLMLSLVAGAHAGALARVYIQLQPDLWAWHLFVIVMYLPKRPC